jgi:PAS domain S-box-containing protein
MTFRAKTILGIALIESILLGILVLGGLRWLHDSNESQMILRSDELTRLYTTSIKEAVLASDLAKLHAIANDAIHNKGIEYLRILDANGLVLETAGDSKLLSQQFVTDIDPSNVEDGIYDTGANIEIDGIIYGRLELGLSVEEFHAILSQARHFGFSMAFLEVILVGLFSFALGTYLTSQLSSLSEASERIGREGPGFMLPVRGRDELAQVSIAFNSMSKNLVTSYRELHENAEKYRSISKRLAEGNAIKHAMLSTAMDAIVTIDDHGRIHDFNKAAEAIFGYTIEEVLGRDMAELIIPDEYREAHRQGIKQWHETREGPLLSTRIEITAMRKGGTVFPIEMAITPIEVEKEHYFTGFIRDIKDRKLAESELKLAACAFDSQEAIFITDASSRILRVNNSFCEITGYSAEESIGHTPAELLKSGRQSDEFYTGLWQQLKETGHWKGEIYNRFKNGEIAPEWLSITAVRNDDNITTHYVAHFVDISERKRFESELRKSHELAEQASQAKSKFLASMSHEIRTPLNAIINLNFLLLDTPLDEQQRKLVQGAYEGGKALAALVGDILDLSKIEAGKLKLHHEIFNLHQLINNICVMFRHQTDMKGLNLEIDIFPDVPESVIGDDTRLRQILFNLVGNAIKFTEEGHVKLTVQKETNGEIQFVIEDTGIGISDEDQTILFEDFSQADATLTRRYGGTGLGLAISRKLVVLMKGGIGFRGRKPHGSIFLIHVPLEPASEREAEHNTLVREEPLHAHVLVAEDSKTNQLVVKSLLNKIGCEVTLANNGEEAVKLTEAVHFDLVFMDLSMPVMDGLEATRKIRNLDSAHKNVPIIAITANAFSEDRDKCLQAGMNDFLAKPINPAKLKDCVSQWSLEYQSKTHEDDVSN